MVVKFWGVRGSIPCPLTPKQYQEKLASILQRIRPKDLETQESRELFLSTLPGNLLSTVGGNTTCIEIRNDQDDLILLDAGTGLREMGLAFNYPKESGAVIHIFFTHFHWDHIQGIPFFTPFFNKNNVINFYSPVPGFEKILRDQMMEPYFPVPLTIFPAKVNFIELKDQPLNIGGTRITWRAVNHPGSCTSYRLEDGGKTLIFSTDTELKTSDFIKTGLNEAFYEGVDVLIMDSQYTLGEAVEKINWGHTSYSLAIDFAKEYNIRKLFLFHHEPNYPDQKIEEIGRLASWYLSHSGESAMEIEVAREGLEFEL